MVDPTDQELARRVQVGEQEAFGELVRRYQAPVFNVCYRFLNDRAEAEDLTQEVFLRAYQRFNQYDQERPFGPWIRRVAANLCLNQLEARQTPTLLLDDERDEPASQEMDDPAVMHQQAEQIQAIRQALAALPPRYRLVIELRHFQELSYEEIAQELRIPLSDVKSHLFRARQLLASKLRPHVP